MFVLSKCRLIAPSWWLSLQNPETVLGKEEHRTHTPGGYSLGRLLGSLGKRDKRGDFVINITGEKNTKITRRISKGD
jgi:hypothetical protein